MKKFLAKSAVFASVMLMSVSMAVAAPAKKNDQAPAATASKATKQAQIDINTASADQLKAIPGFNKTVIDKLVANRPYANKKQLVTKDVISESNYEEIKDSIIAKRPKKSDK